MSKLNQNPRGSLWKIFYIEVRKRFADVLDSVEAVAECVMKGIGFSILPEPDIRRHSRYDQIVLRSLRPTPLTRKLVLVSIDSGRMKMYIKPLAKLLRQPKSSSRRPS